MTVVNPKSISGITSITTASGSDNLLTIHTNNGTERLRIDSTGATKIVTGIVTTLTATTGIVTTLTASTVTSLGDVDIADKIVHTGDTNTAIRFPSADTITAETGGTERLRIASDGSATFTTSGGDDAVLIKGDTYTTLKIQSARDSSDSKAFIQLHASRGSNASPTIIQNGDIVGTINARAYDGNSYASMSDINFEVDGAPGDGDMPGRIVFKTSADGAQSPTERLRIDSSGKLIKGHTSNIGQIRTQYQAFTQLYGSSNSTGLKIGTFSDDAYAGNLEFIKSRSATIGTNTLVQNNDNLGSIYWGAADGSQYQPAAVITADMDGSTGTDDIPTRLTFFTAADGSNGPTERVRIDSSVNLKFNSGFGSVTTVYGCRAWIQLNQGGSQSITGSGGVSSITDQGTGATQITFTTAMPDDNFAMVGGAQQSSDSSVNYGFSLCMQSYTTAHAILIYRPTATSDVKQDNSKIHVAFFR